ncbi:nuclear receptor coactivator 5 [Sabethes cyaneus]|uniref:nuclear receptor coactivator 5 n=1 Tax=Sabethes cyaneus TaxID=53552 RepID=UPI00237E23E9|nr:nuclear receptor coactivator 5 [Sabethes cyaneus]
MAASIVPEPVISRVYIGGLGEQATRQDMEELFKDYEPYTDLNLLRGYGFVQFPSEEAAKKAITGLNGKSLKGRKLTVKIANDNRAKKGLLPRGAAGGPDGQMVRDRSPIDGNRGYPESFPPRGAYRGAYPGMDMGGYPDPMMRGHPGGGVPMQQPESNDCEIIVVSRDLTTYAENIEARLKRNGLTVDLLFPNDDVPIGKVLSNIASRGSYYAILITPENEERNSITVNVLYGVPAEHRNMPTEDAIMFICKDYEEKLRAEREKLVKYRSAMMQSNPQSANNPSHMMYNAPPLQDKHPEPIQNMINLLAANRQLTVLQYDRLIKYLNQRKEMQVKYELGEDMDSVSANQLMTAKSKEESEKDLQRKIMDILNKPSIIAPKPKPVEPEPEVRTTSSGGFSSFGGLTVASVASINSAAANLGTASASASASSVAPIASATPKLLHDPKVQKALDSLLLSGLGGALKF